MSLNNGSGNTYGLIIPGKKAPVTRVPVQTAFGHSDSDGDEEEAKFRKPNFDVKLETIKANIRKTTKINLEKALSEDAAVFQYDEVYDDITRAKDAKVLEKYKPAARKPKYINDLLKVSSERKLEQELLMERKAQRELEQEKNLYGDKEAFVTGAYKEKMAEIRKLVEQRKEEEARENVMDVTKQDGLGGLYRYMYQQIAAPTDASKVEKQEKDEQGVPKEPLSPRKSHSDAENAIKAVSTALRSPHHDRHKSSPRRNEHSSNSSHRRDEVRYSDRERYNEANRSRGHGHRDSHISNRGSSHGTDRSRYHDSERRGQDRPVRSDSRTYRQDRWHQRDAHKSDSRRTSSNRRHRRRSHSPSPKKKEVVKKRSKTPPGFIRAKPVHTTDKELAEAKRRFLVRRDAGIHADVVNSDEE